MSDSWIYIGADIRCNEWSKVGKTTAGLHTRHRSPQRPGYFIYVAYKIEIGDVHEIELELLNYLKSNYSNECHFSTGNKSECFSINPYEMTELVECFIGTYYPASIIYDPILPNLVVRYQCTDSVYSKFKNALSSVTGSFESISAIPSYLDMTKNDYYNGNQIRHEADLGNGYFIDFGTGRQGYRYEDGTVEWYD